MTDNRPGQSTRKSKTVASDTHFTDQPHPSHAPFDPVPSSSSLPQESLPAHVPTAKVFTRQIKTRSMTSANTAGSTVAFGGTVPKRDTRPPPKKKSCQASGSNRLKENGKEVKTSADGTETRSGPALRPENNPIKPQRQIRLRKPLSSHDDHASVGTKSLRRAEESSKENIPVANLDHVRAPLYHRTRSCAAINASNTANSPTKNDSDLVQLQSCSSLASNLTNTSSLQTNSHEVVTVSSTQIGTLSTSIARPHASVSSGREQPDQSSSAAINRALFPTANLQGQSLSFSNKRLFEEIDDSTNQNLFSFLDAKGKSKQTAPKAGTRPVYKTSQPLANRQTVLTKPATVGVGQDPHLKARRKLPTSIRAQAIEPSRKKVRPSSPSPIPKRTSTKKLFKGAVPRRIMPTLQAAQQQLPSISGPSDQTEPPQQSGSQLNPPTMNVNPVNSSAPTPTTFNESSIVEVPLQAPELRNQPSSSFATTSQAHNPFAPQALLTTDQQRTPSKRPFTGTSISPLPVIIKRKDSDGDTEEDTSADAFLLSPKKRNKPTSSDIAPNGVNNRDDRPASLVPNGTKESVMEEVDRTFAEPVLPPTVLPLLSTLETDSDACSTPIEEAIVPVLETSEAPLHSIRPEQRVPSPKQISESSKASSSLMPAPADDEMENSKCKPSSSATPTSELSEPHESNSRRVPIGDSTPPESPRPILSPKPTPPRSFQPIRTSPIKQATMPTSIPISPSQHSSPSPEQPKHQPRNPFRPPPNPSTSTATGQIPKRPSMLPRRTVKASQSSSSTSPMSLDAIVENSPAKPVVRDALGAGSLNLSRGHNVPPKVIFTGGIKAKAIEFYNRQHAFLQKPAPESQPLMTKDVPKLVAASVTTPVAEDVEDDGGAADVSANSFMSNQSVESTSTTTSANISQDTQDRLLKLQAMLTRMNVPRTEKPAYEEYEVPLKDSEDSEDRGVRATRSRRRSVSVGAPSHTGSRLKSRASASGLRNASRRESSILPSAEIEGRGAGPSRAEDRLKKVLPLKDVVALVDVRTAEGDEAGRVFVEMLRGLGAKVPTRPTFPLTHIVFKAGKQATIDRWLIHPKPKPCLVGIGWVVRCREVLGKASETPYLIDINSTTAPTADLGNLSTSVGPSTTAGASNRRKSMEPKALALLSHGVQLDRNRAMLSQSCESKPASGPDAQTLSQPDRVAQSIDRARRKSLQFLPKVGSPLGKKVFGPEDGEDTSMESR
ncbi:hypothetical protein CROQUDRAFT_650235 [Cronartium quercuum f. sp. fusiforme G11]|uniref:BRCT domain-containing protein n=1 Tax=Cronartium quercuum f. sp. fusiforme G11 TaxID=708437 RepID=A0A9P6THX2_9BASI|nr:hypothetical protein CROQUDRAFT_650235 [Cronartium quercuum f. sp. fusiforme G11]